MSLQRRLLIYLLVCAPVVWAVAALISVDRARHQVNELFDTEMIRLARQVQSTLRSTQSEGADGMPALPAEGSAGAGEADVRDLAVAVWDSQGRLLLNDREGIELQRRPDATGFVDDQLHGENWRVYYLQSPTGEWLVAAGQKSYERDELVFELTVSQLAPWLLVLPALLVAMAWAVRRALKPVHALTAELQQRKASDLQPIESSRVPSELQPLLAAMNGLFTRIEETLARERRFTADAAHELRTPLAVLRAQWDVVRRAAGVDERRTAEAKLDAGMARMDRLVTQMLALSRVEAAADLAASARPVAWPRVVEEAFSDCLALAERRRIELACEWPTSQQDALPLTGDEHLMIVMLRNLLDNAVRYAPPASLVVLRFTADHLEIENDGEPLAPAHLALLGERFHRPEGQDEVGSGLGVSIVQRIAALHGLRVVFSARADGRGMKVVLRRQPLIDAGA